MTAWYDPVVMCERHWRKGTDAKKMPGTTITKDLTGMEERIFLVLAGSVSCSPKGSRNGHSGTKTSRRSHRPLPLLRQDPAQGHKEPKEQEKQADSSSGVLPGHSPSACSVPPRFSQVVQGFSPGPQSLHKKCLQKPVPRNLNWALTRGARSKQAVPVQSVLWQGCVMGHQSPPWWQNPQS